MNNFIELFPLESIFFSLILNLFFTFLFVNQKTLFKFILIAFALINFFLICFLVKKNFFSGLESEIEILITSQYLFFFKIDSLSLIFALLISILWPISLLYTIYFIKINNFHRPYFFLFFINLSIVFAFGIAFANNLFTLFTLYELLTLATLPLVMYHSHIKNSEFNVISYYKILQFSSVLLFLPALAFFNYYGNSLEANIAKDFSYPDYVSTILFLAFVLGIAKSSIFPIFYWLINAMVASYPVSALLHSLIVVKVGIFSIYKIMILGFGLDYLEQIFGSKNWILFFPILGIIYSSIKAMRTNVIKTILAYSTINHLNIAIMSAFLFTEKSLKSSILHVISHSINKIAIFYSMGIISSFVNNAYNIKNLLSAYKILPITSFCLVFFSLSIFGVPPLAGFISKYNILLSAMEVQNYLVIFTLLFSSFCSAVYFFNIIKKIYSPLKESRYMIFNIKSHIRKIYKIKSCSDEDSIIERKIFFPMIISLFIFLLLNFVFYFLVTFIKNFLVI
ncbi:MAG: cation:proton antiporter [Rickettsia sp.]|nr:cation:proton antiporter [Rickettsia sp.]